MNDSESIALHYEQCWGETGKPLEWKKGPTWQMPANFQILAFPPSEKKREMWTYATCGMSSQGDAPPFELHLFSPVETEEHVELLTAIAHYHLTGDYLDLGHTAGLQWGLLPGQKAAWS
jgi:hypothetical protein